MTSETGSLGLSGRLLLRAPLFRLPGPVGLRGRGDRGFTLVEILVVMAIVVLLFAVVAGGVMGLRGRAAQKATNALISKLRLTLDEYKDMTGSYPPDGIDSPVKNDEGEPIQGSACLYYFLSKRPWVAREMVAGKVKLYEVPPRLKLLSVELTQEDDDYPGVREVQDGWKNPIHYDNTEDGRFTPQGGDVHTPPVDDDEHPDDPRIGDFVVDGANAVVEPGIQSRGYDLWSHGDMGHDLDGPKSLPVASWNLRE